MKKINTYTVNTFIVNIRLTLFYAMSYATPRKIEELILNL